MIHVDDEDEYADEESDLESALSASDDDVNLEIDEEPEHDEKYKAARSDLVRAALETQLMEYAKRRNEQKRNLEELTCIIEEFMDSFIVLGYNYDGDPLTLVSASTQQQADSLSTLLQKFIVQSGQGKGPGSIL